MPCFYKNRSCELTLHHVIFIRHGICHRDLKPEVSNNECLVKLDVFPNSLCLIFPSSSFALEYIAECKWSCKN